jgi:hypothetical protein
LSNEHGVIELAIYPNRITTRFIPIAGKTYSDTATTFCDGVATDTIPTPPDTTQTPPDTVPTPPSIQLKVVGRSDATKDYMTLSWTGATGANVDVFRNGALISVQVNDGHYVNSRVIQPRPTVYRYKVCGTSGCSNEASVSYP